jgi:hypothetical protein
MVRAIAAAAYRQACIVGGLEQSCAGTKAEKNGEEDGERTQHAN